MRPADLIRMSAGSLIRRKVRTLLTVLGVVIGIASIVIMVSLGLGLNHQSMELIEQYGGLTTINVSEGNSGNGRMGDSSKASKDPLAHKLTDEAVAKIAGIEHVELASPLLRFQCILRCGAYVSEMYGCTAYTLDTMKAMNWKFSEGGLPQEGEPLKLIYGNMMLKNFQNAATGLGFYDTGKLPEIDLMNQPVFAVFDVDAYRNFHSSPQSEGGSGSGGEGGDQKGSTAPPKKYLVPAAGILYGENEDDYRDYSYEVYCDIEALKKMQKQVFRNKPIPDQPVRSNGQPYRQLFYSGIYVRSDSVDHVEEIQKVITEMGYEAYSNFEWIEQTRKQSRSQQAMLGGIGAVSLLVAAIGIANTMMMSIYERTREIGVMKVLGCDLSDIRSLFLLEATLIGFLGGVAGGAISLAASFLINYFTHAVTSLVPPWLLFLGLFFAVFVGMAAGYFPSKRAMQLSPLAALRNE